MSFWHLPYCVPSASFTCRNVRRRAGKLLWRKTPSSSRCSSSSGGGSIRNGYLSGNGGQSLYYIESIHLAKSDFSRTYGRPLLFDDPLEKKERDVYKKNGQLLLLFWKFQPYNTLTLWDSLGRVQGKWLGSERDPVNWSGSIGWRRPLLLLFLLSVTYTQVTDVATSGHVATGRGQELCPIYNYIHWNLCSNSGWTRGRRNKSAPLLKRKKKKKKWPPFQSKTET